MVDRDCGMNGLIPSSMGFNIINNGEVLVDPSLQPFLAMQGNKTIGLSLSEDVPGSNHILHNNNISPHSFEATSYMMQESLSNSDGVPKKLCPLEMSIKAADLDLEFEKDSYVLTNNGLCPVTMNNQCVESVSLTPYTTVVYSNSLANMTHSNAVYTQPMMAPAEHMAVALQPAPMLLLQIQPHDAEMSSQPVIVAPPQLLLPPEPLRMSTALTPSVITSSTMSPSMQSTFLSHSISPPPSMDTSSMSSDHSMTPEQPVVVSTLSTVVRSSVDAHYTLSPPTPMALSSDVVFSTATSMALPSDVVLSNTTPMALASDVAFPTVISGSEVAFSSAATCTSSTPLLPCDIVPTVASPAVPPSAPTVPFIQHTEIMREKSESSADDESARNMESLICEVDESGDSISSLSEEECEEQAVQSLVLKIRKVPVRPRRRALEFTSVWNEKLEKVKERRELEKEGGPKAKKRKKARYRIEFSSVTDKKEDGWSSSDDETLAKVIKQTQEDIAHENNRESFRRAPKCCPRCCHVKILPKYQEIAFRKFLEMEKCNKGDCYLAKCVKLSPLPAPTEPQPSPTDSCSRETVDDLVVREIANESNGDKFVSDEIENAIRESLRDQETVGGDVREGLGSLLVDAGETVGGLSSANGSGAWTYFLVINNRLRAACLNLLLAVLRIPLSRVEAIQRKIIEGGLLDRAPVLSRSKKASGVWRLAKSHLETFLTTDVPYCQAKPPHKRLLESLTRNQLFDQFRNYYLEETGSVLTTRFDTYRRLLVANSTIVFPDVDEIACAGCNATAEQAPYHSSSGIKGKAAKKSNMEDNAAAKTLKIPRKRATESVSADTPNVPVQIKVRRKTGDSVVNGDKKSRLENGAKKEKVARKRPQKKGPRGDVFSLMLVHLKTLPYTVPAACKASERHMYFNPEQFSPQTLYDEYRKFFLKETNSELGLRYQLYESLLLRNRAFSIARFDSDATECPRCAAEPPVVTLESAKLPKKKNAHSVAEDS